MFDGRHMETIEMLAATIAHEVKNPLSLIGANVDYIELCDKDKRYSKNYRVIRDELRKTNDMLCRFIEMIRLMYKFDEDVTIYDVMMNVVENYRHRTEKICFKVECPNKNLSFRGNFQLFTMAVSNVVKNAAEAMSDTGGEIMLRAVSEGDEVVVTISDNGPGLSHEAERYISENSSYTSKETGSGAGVDICRNIAAEHGGTYDIRNADGGGCVVTMTIPAEGRF